MLSGPDLAEALKRAMKLKGVRRVDMAAHFGVSPPSINGWTKSGRIHKKHIDQLVTYFADVVPPSHWGINHTIALESREPIVGGYQALTFEPRVKAWVGNPDEDNHEAAEPRKRRSNAERLISAIKAAEKRHALTDDLTQHIEWLIQRL